VKHKIIEDNERFYKLIAIQVMPNHVHLILQPKPGYALSRIIKGMKGVTARLVNRYRRTKGSIWSDKYFDRAIRTEDDLAGALAYLQHNPVGALLAEDASDYVGWEFIQE